MACDHALRSQMRTEVQDNSAKKKHNAMEFDLIDDTHQRTHANLVNAEDFGSQPYGNSRSGFTVFIIVFFFFLDWAAFAICFPRCFASAINIWRSSPNLAHSFFTNSFSDGSS